MNLPGFAKPDDVFQCRFAIGFRPFDRAKRPGISDSRVADDSVDRRYRESARFNTAAVIVKVFVVVFFIALGGFYVSPANWHPFMPNGFPGLMGGAAIVFSHSSVSMQSQQLPKKRETRSETCRLECLRH